MRRPMHALAATALLTLLAACGESFDPNDPTQLVISNESGQVIEMLNFSTCDEPDFGPDRLDSTEDISPGTSRHFDIDPGCYDIRVWFPGGETEIRLEEEISDGETFVWTVE